MRQASQKTVQAVGDGTSVTQVIAYNIFKEAYKLSVAGINPMSLRKGIEEARDKVIKEIERLSIPIKTKEQMIHIATISAADKELGEMIGTLIHDLGKEGIVTVDETNKGVTHVEMIEGMQFDKGYINQLFVTNPQRMEATIEDPYILVTDKVLSEWTEFVPLAEKLAPVTRNLVVIAQAVEDTVLESFIMTKLKGGMNILAINAPLFADKQKAFLADVAILTGAKFVTEDAGMKTTEIEVEDLGHADRVTSTKDATVIVGGKGDKYTIQERIKSLQLDLDRQTSQFETEKLRERIGKLSKGIAVIKVGGQTDIEIKERKERVIDAIAATQAARDTGIVPGGETIYLLVRDVLDNNPAHNIVYNALEKPFAKLLENAGLNYNRFIDKISLEKGMDVQDQALKDLVKAGVVDPTKVPVEALRNAVSVAIQLLTTKALVVYKDEKRD
jgi:chaperonin GroEL